MRLNVNLSKLEQKAKVTLRCDWCRYVLSDMSPAAVKDQKSRPKDETYQGKCPWCGTKYNSNLSRFDQHEREAYRLEHDKCHGEIYRDERVFAAREWLGCRRLLRDWRGQLEAASSESLSRPSTSSSYNKPKTKPSREAQRRIELKEKAFLFYRRMHEEESEKYAPHTFTLYDEIQTLKESKDKVISDIRYGKYVNGTHIKTKPQELRARDLIYLARVAELCERVLWGETLSETQEIIATLQPMIEEFERERIEKEREIEEEEARRKAEREAREQERSEAYQSPTSTILQNMFPTTNLPPDDGTARYQQKLAYWRQTGVWMPDEW